MVTSEDYPYLTVEFIIRGHWYRTVAYLDTDTDEHLIIPEHFRGPLGSPDDTGPWRLEDGSEALSGEYDGRHKHSRHSYAIFRA